MLSTIYHSAVFFCPPEYLRSSVDEELGFNQILSETKRRLLVESKSDYRTLFREKSRNAVAPIHSHTVFHGVLLGYRQNVKVRSHYRPFFSFTFIGTCEHRKTEMHAHAIRFFLQI